MHKSQPHGLPLSAHMFAELITATKVNDWRDENLASRFDAVRTLVYVYKFIQALMTLD